MKRRKFLKATTAAGAAIAAAGVAAPALAFNKKEIKVTLGFPKGFPGFGDFILETTKKIEQISEGKLTFKIYGAGELIGPFEGVDAVGRGTLDMFYSAPYYFQAKSKAFNFFTTLPFGMTTLEHFAWMTHGGGEQLADELFAKFNMKHLMAGQTYMQWGGWFNKKINSAADIKGLKIRVTGLGGEVYKQMGATPVITPVSEAQAAMASGVVDAIEMNGPWVDQIIGFQKLAKYYYYPGWQEPTTNMSLGVNLDLWKSFTKAEQGMIQWAVESGIVRNFGQHFSKCIEQLARLRKENPKLEILQFPDDVMIAMGKTSLKVMEDLAKTDADWKKIWDSYMPFLKGSIDLTARTDQPFINARAKVFG